MALKYILDTTIHCPAVHGNAMSREGAGALPVTQEAARVGRRLAVLNADKGPAGGPVNRHKQIAAEGLIRHSLPDR